jgi:hypothetical protein
LYPKGKDLSLVSYTDVDWIGCIDDRRVTSGEVFYLGPCLVSWLRKKQSLVSLSTVEVEYIATVACCTQVLWMKQTLKYIQVEYDEPIPIYCDNTSSISISKNLVIHSKMKNIPIVIPLAEPNCKCNNVLNMVRCSDIILYTPFMA